MSSTTICSEAEPSAFVVVTPWQVFEPSPEDVSGAVAPDAEKHHKFRELVLELMVRQCPWLLAIVKAAEGQILAMPGGLYVAVPATSTDWIEVPELSAQLRLLPWREGEETEH